MRFLPMLCLLFLALVMVSVVDCDDDDDDGGRRKYGFKYGRRYGKGGDDDDDDDGHHGRGGDDDDDDGGGKGFRRRCGRKICGVHAHCYHRRCICDSGCHGNPYRICSY